MSTEVATRAAGAQSPNSLKAAMMERSEDFQAALPPHIPVERFMRVVQTAIASNPDLGVADRRSLWEATMKAAQDGLLPDGRDGAFVIFNAKEKGEGGRDQWIKKVQWMPMVGGILKKIRNSGELLSIGAHVVYSNDTFSYALGDDERIEHVPCLDENRGTPQLVYAIAKTKDGGIYREVMTIKDVEKVRNVSRSKDKGPWKDWYDEMAKKTVIRRLAKRLPMSTDLDDLMRRDDDLYDFSGQRAEGAPPVSGPRSNLRQLLTAAPRRDDAQGFSAGFVTNTLGGETVDAETGEVLEGNAPEADHAKEPQHDDAKGGVAPTQEDGHVDDRTTSSGGEGGGEPDGAPPPSQDDVDALAEFSAELFETRTVEAVKALSTAWKARLNALGAVAAGEAAKRRDEHVKTLKAEAAADASIDVLRQFEAALNAAETEEAVREVNEKFGKRLTDAGHAKPGRNLYARRLSEIAGGAK